MLILQYLILMLQLSPIYRVSLNTVFFKAWLATYFELPHPQLRNPKSLRTRNRAQLAFLMVATRKRNRNFIKF